MSQGNSLKKEIDRLMNLKEDSTGEILRTHEIYIRHRKGEKGLRAVEKEMAALGYHLTCEELEKYQWYPVQMNTLFLVPSKKIFNWDKDEMWQWGSWAAKMHFLTKMMIKYFTSKELLAKSANRNWRKYYTQGELIFAFEEKKGTVEVKDFIIYPGHLDYLAGYLYQIASLVMPPERLELEPLRTDKLDCHFLV